MSFRIASNIGPFAIVEGIANEINSFASRGNYLHISLTIPSQLNVFRSSKLPFINSLSFPFFLLVNMAFGADKLDSSIVSTASLKIGIFKTHSATALTFPFGRDYSKSEASFAERILSGTQRLSIICSTIPKPTLFSVWIELFLEFSFSLSLFSSYRNDLHQYCDPLYFLLYLISSTLETN